MSGVRKREDVVLYITAAKCGRRSEAVSVPTLLRSLLTIIGDGFLQMRMRLQIQYQQLDCIPLSSLYILYQYAGLDRIFN